MADMEAFAERIEKAIGDAVAAGEIDGGGFGTGFTIAGHTIDADGDPRMFTASNCRLVETLGLLEMARVIQRRTAEPRGPGRAVQRSGVSVVGRIDQ